MSDKSKILFVDDDPEVLAAYKRAFRKSFTVETALGPLEGLAAIAENGPYAVVVSDLRMPGMDGIEFFTQLKARCPDTVRIMLTGFADIASAMAAVNQGHVFRFLSKPCSEQDMADALAMGVRQYRLITAEREFIRGTLKGVIKVLTDLLAFSNPTAHERCARMKRLVVDLGRAMDMQDPWRLELAVMLSQLGFLILPERLLQLHIQGAALNEEQAALYDLHPKLAGDLLANIPRLEEIAAIIAMQERRFDGTGPPETPPSVEPVRGRDIPLGARILKVALDFDALQLQGRSRMEALKEMRGRKGWYDREILRVMEPLLGEREGYQRATVPPGELAAGMLLETPVPGAVIPESRPLRAREVSRVREAAQSQGIERLEVFVPKREPSILDEIDPALVARIQAQKALLAREQACVKE